MASKLAVNARYQHRRIAGVERCADELSRRLNMQKRFIKPNRPLGGAAGHVWEQFILPRLLRKDEILWSPANSSAWSVANQVVTIHDASVFDHPEWFAPAFGAWTRLSWNILAKRAKAIITVSEFSKERLQYRLKIPEGNIHVVFNGVGEPFEPQSERRVNEVKKKYRLDKPYFLFTGTRQPRKNLGTLIQAWEMANLKKYKLFIAGEESAGRVFNVTGYGHSIRHAGSRYAALTAPLLDHQSVAYMPDEDLPALYSGATAFVFPSLYEGFGLPVLEAMACGTPVIAADIATFREIYGGAALLVNPREPKEIADAMQTMIEDASLSEKLRERGFKKAKELTWEKSALKTQSILEKAGGSHL